MDRISIQLGRGDRAYVPGEPITGEVAWDLAEAPKRVTVRLLWQTSGRGTRDTTVVAEQQWEMLSVREERPFEFAGQPGPYSYSGKLITLGWFVEVTSSDGHHDEQTLMLSPTGEEVRP